MHETPGLRIHVRAFAQGEPAVARVQVLVEDRRRSPHVRGVDDTPEFVLNSEMTGPRHDFDPRSSDWLAPVITGA